MDHRIPQPGERFIRIGRESLPQTPFGSVQIVPRPSRDEPVYRQGERVVGIANKRVLGAHGRRPAVAERILASADRYAYEMPIREACVRCGGNRVALDRRLERPARGQKIFA